MDHRTCRKCGLEKPVGKFRKDRGSNKAYTCTACVSKSQYSRSRAVLLSQGKDRRVANPSQAVWADCRKSDRRLGRQNDLTKDFVRSALSQACSYCGDTTLRMTLDRIDNSLGHLASNVVPACIRCNYFRGSVPYEAWLRIVPGVKEAVDLGLFGDWTGRCR
jgi:hypothetical protein